MWYDHILCLNLVDLLAELKQVASAVICGDVSHQAVRDSVACVCLVSRVYAWMQTKGAAAGQIGRKFSNWERSTSPYSGGPKGAETSSCTPGTHTHH